MSIGERSWSRGFTDCVVGGVLGICNGGDGENALLEEVLTVVDVAVTCCNGTRLNGSKKLVDVAAGLLC